MTRVASPADLDAIMAVEQASFDTSRQWSRTSWAGEDEVAAVATFHGFDVADLDRIMVTPAARGHGLAVELLSRGIDWARSRGVPRHDAGGAPRQ